MKRDDYPQRRSDLAFRPVGDEGGLVVNSDQAEVKVLNPVGSHIFGLLDGKHSREQIIEAIVDEFEVDPSEARADLDAFVDELAAHGMMAGSRRETVKETEG